VQETGHATADDHNALAGLQPSQPLTPQDTTQGFDHRPVRPRQFIGQSENAPAGLEGRYANILGKSAGVHATFLQDRTDRLVAGIAVIAGSTGYMVSHDDPVPGPKVGDTGADLDDLACDLMAQDDGSPGPAIPFEDVRTADAAGSYANEHLTGPDLRDGPLF
jgi:hypothetical protein